jgi:hypothetical protein
MVLVLANQPNVGFPVLTPPPKIFLKQETFLKNKK